MTALLPCPFCGQEPQSNTLNAWCNGPPDNPHGAINLQRDKWNTRAQAIGDADKQAVAWRFSPDKGEHWHLRHKLEVVGKGWMVEPLYTHPAPPADKQADGLDALHYRNSAEILRSDLEAAEAKVLALTIALERIKSSAGSQTVYDIARAALEQASKAGGGA